ncbi:hypothetical protein NQZ68_040671 [Dissostichus eleginoides]|nr:hypothetical protein NQZ68_040671 [Dissostichus eleginoides]
MAPPQPTSSQPCRNRKSHLDLVVSPETGTGSTEEVKWLCIHVGQDGLSYCPSIL